jgi:two-component system KDP operon response regulator KdpE
VLILDSAIPGDGAAETCRAIRRKSELGIIVLSRDDERQYRIDALNAGADDYIPARFAMAELQARVRAVLRRVANPPALSGHIRLEDRTIDLGARKVRGPRDRVTGLTPKEFDLLQQLVSRPGQPLTHHALTQAVWQREARGEIEYLRVVIQQLRRKLELEPDRPRHIVTERGVGYVFHMPASPGPAVARCA